MTANKNEKKVGLFAFDLDGTLYAGDKAIGGAVELVEFLRAKCKVVYFTNNSSKTVWQIRDKLERLGFRCGPDEVYTSSFATAAYLKKGGIDDLYVVGSKGFRQELVDMGLKLADEGSARNLVVGLDFEFNYEKIAAALTVLLRGGKYIACNEDRSFPAGGGVEKPGCGAMVGAISAVSGRAPDFIVGKPNIYIMEKIAKDHGVTNEGTVVVGDSYESDIRMALNYKCRSVLIGGRKPGDRTVTRVKDLSGLREYTRRVLQ